MSADVSQRVERIVERSGNPVLESMVALAPHFFSSAPGSNESRIERLRELHAVILELANKEPGGLQRTHKTTETVAEFTSPADAHPAS